jgi:hypothetical protein
VKISRKLFAFQIFPVYWHRLLLPYHLTRLTPKIILVVNGNTRNYIIQSYYCAKWYRKVTLAVGVGEALEYYSPTVLTEGDWNMMGISLINGTLWCG